MKSPTDPREEQIIRSWNTNAEPWAEAVQAGSIVSRRLVTDRAIVDAISSLQPKRIFDVGCGEGWLSRTLLQLGMHTEGIDVVPALIAAARAAGGGEFSVHSFEEVAQGRFKAELFDLAVCNFSLLGDDSVRSLIIGLASYLGVAGYLVIQTLHPIAACGDRPYVDGWRAGSWVGFDAEFTDPAPWYFRTLQSWFALLRAAGFAVIECREPTAPGACAPSSVIFICKLEQRQ
jgi:2-polyprenyl-3-methyl-5-hydroxy-6-metoxy-1,4-benzoquinol methylase